VPPLNVSEIQLSSKGEGATIFTLIQWLAKWMQLSLSLYCHGRQ